MQCEILKKVNAGVFRTVKRNTKSKIWQIFSLIQDEHQEIINGFVYCGKCNNLFKYNGKQTSNLIRHKCYIEHTSSTELKKVSRFDKEDIINVCSQWVEEDCRPFSAIRDDGFKKLAQALINIGAKYGSHADISDLIPDPTTISNRLQSKAKEKRSECKKEVKKALLNETTELWTEDFIKRNFVCITYHFMKESQLKHIVLDVKSMNFQSCTQEHILDKLKCILRDYEPAASSTKPSEKLKKEKDASSIGRSNSANNKRKHEDIKSSVNKKKRTDPAKEEIDNESISVISTVYSELTGFDKGLEAEMILGASDFDGDLYFLIQFKGADQAEMVAASVANAKAPQVVIKFYEERLSWYLNNEE